MANVLDLKNPEPAPTEPIDAPPLEGLEDATIAGVSAPIDPPQAQWEARHVLSERGRYRHYVALAGFAFAGGMVAWWQSSWLTFLTILLGLAAWELHERLGKPVRVLVNERGVNVNGRQYPHATLASFDLHRMPDDTVELSLATREWHWQRLRLPLGQQDPEEVRVALSHYVVEEDHGVPLIDWLIRKG